MSIQAKKIKVDVTKQQIITGGNSEVVANNAAQTAQYYANTVFSALGENPLQYGAIDDGNTNCIIAFTKAAQNNKPIVMTGNNYTMTIETQDQANTVFSTMGNLHLLNKNLSIKIAPGVYNFSSRITLKMTNGEKLKITPVQDPIDLGFTTLGDIVSNGERDHIVQFNISNTSNVNVGDYVTVTGLVGENFAPLEGFWPVVVKTDTYIKVKNTCYSNTLGSPIVTSGTIKKPTVIFKFTNTMGFYVNCNMGTDSGEVSGLRNIGIVGVGTGSYDGVFVEYDSKISIPSCFIHGFGRFGVYGLYNSTILGTSLICSNCGTSGMYGVSGATFQLVGSISTGHGSYAAVASAGSLIAGTNSNWSGSIAGAYSVQMSTIVCRNLKAERNKNYGVLARSSSFIDFLNGVAANNGVDISETDVTSMVSDGTGTIIEKIPKPEAIYLAEITHTFGTINAGEEASLVVNMPGVLSGDTNVVVTMNTRIPGLVLQAVPGTNIVTIYAICVKLTGSIVVPSRTYRIEVTKWSNLL